MDVHAKIEGLKICAGERRRRLERERDGVVGQRRVDDPTFANPVPARVSGSTWSVAIPTPAAGKHTIYAESTQGFDTSAPASTTFTVKR